MYVIFPQHAENYKLQFCQFQPLLPTYKQESCTFASKSVRQKVFGSLICETQSTRN